MTKRLAITALSNCFSRVKPIRRQTRSVRGLSYLNALLVAADQGTHPDLAVR